MHFKAIKRVSIAHALHSEKKEKNGTLQRPSGIDFSFIKFRYPLNLLGIVQNRGNKHKIPRNCQRFLIFLDEILCDLHNFRSLLSSIQIDFGKEKTILSSFSCIQFSPYVFENCP